MKKVLVTIMVVAILTSSFMLTVAAANYEHVADELNELGLFQGTTEGYDLDSAPNRIQAIVMLIRLLGLEEEALACEAEHPFTDVSGWQVPYVAFAFENELTAGMTETTFDPNGPCSAQMYVTYVLRALGYSSAEDGDFTYAGAVEFGKSIGIIDDMLASGEFLRDEMVAVSYLALITAPNGGDFECLLEKLVSEGAVSEEAAAVLFNKLALLAEFNAIGAPGDKDAFAATVNFTMDMGVLGSASIDMDMSMIIDDGDVIAAISMAMDMAGEELEMLMYLVDGFAYIEADGEKMKLDLGISGYEDLLSIADAGQVDLSIFMIADISKTVEGDLTVYSLTYADSFMDQAMDLVSGLTGGLAFGDMGLGDLGLDDLDLDVTITEMKYCVDSDGNLKNVIMAFDMSLNIESMSMKISYTFEIEITATGDDVTVELPDDLDEYELMDLEALAAAGEAEEEADEAEAEVEEADEEEDDGAEEEAA